MSRGMKLFAYTIAPHKRKGPSVKPGPEIRMRSAQAPMPLV